MLARLLVLVGLLSLLTACGGGAAFRPYKAAYAHGLTPVTRVAVVAYDGDLETLNASGGSLVGFVKTGSDKAAAKYGARWGGTHVALLKAETHVFNVGTNCQTYGVNTTCQHVNVAVPERHYALIRVEPQQWDTLPPSLTPKDQQDECAPPPKPPTGCSYTHRDGFSGYNPFKVYMECPGKFTSDVTDKMPEGMCLID